MVTSHSVMGRLTETGLMKYIVKVLNTINPFYANDKGGVLDRDLISKWYCPQ